MQYKNNTKIIIDKRKLDLLLRLKCSKDVIYNAIVYGKIKKVGDELIDDTLETLVDRKEFKNWGGNHNPAGRNQHQNKNKKRGQLDHQLDLQDGGQNIGQVVDKDKDKDRDRDIDKDNNAVIDYLSNPIIEKVFEIYRKHCINLVPLDRFCRRNIELKKLIGSYLEQTENDLEYFTRVCDIANEILKIGDFNIDLKMILRNHDGLYNGKYKVEEKKYSMLF